MFISGIDVEGDPTSYTITANNTSGAELPKSGGVGTQLLCAIGAGMMAASALVLAHRRSGMIAL